MQFWERKHHAIHFYCFEKIWVGYQCDVFGTRYPPNFQACFADGRSPDLWARPQDSSLFDMFHMIDRVLVAGWRALSPGRFCFQESILTFCKTKEVNRVSPRLSKKTYK